MEHLGQVSSTQLLFPAAAVAVVLICAALVFVFGFHSAEQPQFDKLALVVDDRKSSNKKRKTKDKKSSPNRTANEDVKTKNVDYSKKSPVKEKNEEKVKELEKSKPKEKLVDVKTLKKGATDVKKGKKNRQNAEIEKPADFDEGNWEEVPKKNDKKKVKGPEEKKESPVKKNKKKAKDAEEELGQMVVDNVESDTVGLDTVPEVDTSGDDEVALKLQAQVQELQRVLKEAELREQAALASTDDEANFIEELTEVKDLRDNKRKDKKDKKQKLAEAVKNKIEPEKENIDLAGAQDDSANSPVFNELGDTWTDAKAAKKIKKKARKDQ